MEPQAVIIALEDASRGYDVSPERVPLNLLTRFVQEVQDFVRGSDPLASTDPEVAIRSGSLALELPAVSSPSLLRDIHALMASEDVSQLDPRRRFVVQAWQERAKKRGGVSVRIGLASLERTARIDGASNYRELGSSRLVHVERYVRGEIQDLGGSTKPNVHVRLPDGSLLKVRADRELIRAEQSNLVYKEVELRIRAKLDLDTNQLSDPELIAFEHYDPHMDRAQFEALTERGRKAWADVGDPARWVRSIRGDKR